MCEPSICALGGQLDRFGGGAWLRGAGLDVCALFRAELLAGATLNFAQTGNVAALKVSIAVLELPESGVGVSGVENVSFCSRLGGLCGTERFWDSVIPLWNPYMFNCRTKDEILVCLKYWLGQVSQVLMQRSHSIALGSYERTLEKSAVGDMTKLSAVADQEMRC